MSDIATRVETAVLGTAGRVASRVQERRGLAVDLLESDDAYLAVFDAPDTHAGDVTVRYEDGTVSVSVDRFRENREPFERRALGRSLRLHGSVSLPAEARVDPAEASATLKDNGTLHVRLPKAEHQD